MSRYLALFLGAALLSGPALAQEPYAPPPADSAPPQDYPGIGNLMDNLLNQAQPHLDKLGRDLGETVGALGPLLSDIGDLMDDVRHYQAPERLENGDILIRRRADAPPPPAASDRLRDMLRGDPDVAPDATEPMPPPEALPERDPASEIEL